MTELKASEKIHAELGASVASRWMACPGSIRLSREVPRQGSSSFAEEGTRAHALAELCLTKGVDPDIYVGVEIEGVVVEEEMAEYVKVFIDHCRNLQHEMPDWWVERKFTLAKLTPPAPMFGTADFVAYDKVDRTLYVVDLKYGQGVLVEAKGNKQLRYYGLGAMLSLDPATHPVDRVVMTIVQPRMLHTDGVIRSDEMDALEAIEFAADLMASARAAQEPDAPLNAGSHCRFCPASGICPAQRTKALAVAQQEFEIVTAQEEFTPPAPETIPIEQLVTMVEKFHVLEAWMSASRQVIQSKLERGEEVPGFKLVAKRAMRKWGDASGAAQYLQSESYNEEEIYEPRELKSVAQIEKLVGKKDFAQSPLAGVVVKVSSGHKMVPASDPAPAIQMLTPAEEFARLLPGESE
jgi:hypothetical protein